VSIDEAIRTAVERRDARLAGRVCDQLRLRGLNYAQVHERVCRVAPISLAEWDQLLLDDAWADHGRSGSATTALRG